MLCQLFIRGDSLDVPNVVIRIPGWLAETVGSKGAPPIWPVGHSAMDMRDIAKLARVRSATVLSDSATALKYDIGWGAFIPGT